MKTDPRGDKYRDPEPATPPSVNGARERATVVPWLSADAEDAIAHRADKASGKALLRWKLRDEAQFAESS